MRLNKKQLTKLSKLNLSEDKLITKDGLSFVTGTLKKSGGFIDVGYYTDLPDCQLPLMELKKVIGRLSGASVSVEEGKVNFKTDKVSFSIATKHDSGREPFITEGDSIGTVYAKTLKDYAKFSASGKNEHRKTLKGVHLSQSGICATDAYTMRFSHEPVGDEKGVTIPFDLVDLLLEEEYELIKSGYGKYVLRGDNQVVSFTSLTEYSNFPVWQNVIPEQQKVSGKIELESKTLQDELKFLKTIHDKVELFEGKLRCEDIDKGIDTEVSIEGNFRYDFKIAFNTESLWKIAKECIGDITLNIVSSDRAVVITDGHEQHFLIMPIVLGK